MRRGSVHESITSHRQPRFSVVVMKRHKSTVTAFITVTVSGSSDLLRAPSYELRSPSTDSPRAHPRADDLASLQGRTLALLASTDPPHSHESAAASSRWTELMGDHVSASPGCLASCSACARSPHRTRCPHGRAAAPRTSLFSCVDTSCRYSAFLHEWLRPRHDRLFGPWHA